MITSGPGIAATESHRLGKGFESRVHIPCISRTHESNFGNQFSDFWPRG